MALEAYNPNDAFKFYDDYYRQQVGNGIQVYTGRRHMSQSGAGMGSLFSGILKAAAPFAKNLGKRALATGARIAGDVARGRSLGESARDRFKQSSADLLEDLQDDSPPVTKKKKVVSSRKRKRQKGKGLPRSKMNSIF